MKLIAKFGNTCIATALVWIAVAIVVNICYDISSAWSNMENVTASIILAAAMKLSVQAVLLNVFVIQSPLPFIWNDKNESLYTVAAVILMHPLLFLSGQWDAMYKVHLLTSVLIALFR